jgi:hypothetical protein
MTRTSLEPSLCFTQEYIHFYCHRHRQNFPLKCSLTDCLRLNNEAGRTFQNYSRVINCPHSFQKRSVGVPHSHVRSLHIQFDCWQCSNITVKTSHCIGHELCFKHNKLTGRVGLEKLIRTQLIQKVLAFMVHECPLPCSQEPATGPDSEPNKFSPLTHIQFL